MLQDVYHVEHHNSFSKCSAVIEVWGETAKGRHHKIRLRMEPWELAALGETAAKALAKIEANIRLARKRVKDASSELVP